MQRAFFAFVTVMLLVANGSAQAQSRIKIATLVPENSAWGSQMKAARDEIKERTDGRVKLHFYWGGVQGSGDPATVKKMIRIGQLHGGDFTPTDFQDKLPDLNIYGLPFVFESLDEVSYVRKQMDQTLADGLTKEGFVTFGFAGDFAIILSSVPVRGLADLKGRKVWLPEGDKISDRAMKKLQLVPNSQPVADVLVGLKTGLFDVVTMPAGAAVALQLHTAVKYFTDMPVIYAMQFLAIQDKVFNKLSAEDQAVAREVLTRAYANIDAQVPADAANAKEALANNGIESVTPNDGEFEQIAELMEANNRDMAKQGMYSLDLLELMQQHIDDYRAAQAAELANTSTDAVALAGKQ